MKSKHPGDEHRHLAHLGLCSRDQGTYTSFKYIRSTNHESMNAIRVERAESEDRDEIETDSGWNLHLFMYSVTRHGTCRPCLRGSGWRQSGVMDRAVPVTEVVTPHGGVTERR
ncbi:unnamed protein product [Pleuronectes platessa]|uniref:Uncharacterized protein n=1 Tax=Pleuronectes platessa TaxID=8262 RepID=A0A9N7YBY4_PLEPL|nr:unnamed protein product [Pleuronectes platessa]